VAKVEELVGGPELIEHLEGPCRDSYRPGMSRRSLLLVDHSALHAEA
jgi:hypothetical protein